MLAERDLQGIRRTGDPWSTHREQAHSRYRAHYILISNNSASPPWNAVRNKMPVELPPRGVDYDVVIVGRAFGPFGGDPSDSSIPRRAS